MQVNVQPVYVSALQGEATASSNGDAASNNSIIQVQRSSTSPLVQVLAPSCALQSFLVPCNASPAPSWLFLGFLGAFNAYWLRANWLLSVLSVPAWLLSLLLYFLSCPSWLI